MPSERYNFLEAGDLEDAENRIGILVDETQDIESQLSNPDKQEPGTGKRMSDENYRGWKFQASRALAIKRAEQRFLKRWVRAYHVQRREQVLEALDSDPALGLLNGLYVTVNKWIRDGTSLAHQIQESDQELLNIIQQYLDAPKNSG